MKGNHHCLQLAREHDDGGFSPNFDSLDLPQSIEMTNLTERRLATPLSAIVDIVGIIVVSTFNAVVGRLRSSYLFGADSARSRSIALCKVCTGLSCRGNVFGACSLQDVLRPVHPV